MITEEKEIRDLIHQSLIWSRFRLIIIGIGVLTFPFVVIALKFKTAILILKVVLIFSIYLAIIAIFNLIIRKQSSVKRINELNFLHIIFDFSFLAFLVHYSGGIGWVMCFIYVGFLAFSYINLPGGEAFFLTILLIVLVSGLAVLEYFGILTHHTVFPDFDLYNNFSYLIGTLLVFFGLVVASSATLSFFAGSIRKKSEFLREKSKETQELKDSLEIRVNARKRELQELTKKLDLKAREKSEELHNKIMELQKINTKAIKQELRMIELKRDIKIMSEKIKK